MTDIHGQTDQPRETLWTVGDVAEHLNVAEKTILRMLQREEIPGYRVGTQWRFSPSRIQQWLEDSIVQSEGLGALLARDHFAVHIDRLLDRAALRMMKGAPTRDDVLKELTRLAAAQRSEIEENSYVALLHEREALAETRLGSYLIAPHIRDVARNPAGAMFYSVAILPDGTAEDREVRIAALVCADDLVVHLRMMQKLASLFRTQAQVQRLCQAESEDAAYKRLIELERRKIYADQ